MNPSPFLRFVVPAIDYFKTGMNRFSMIEENDVLNRMTPKVSIVTVSYTHLTLPTKA